MTIAGVTRLASLVFFTLSAFSCSDTRKVIYPEAADGALVAHGVPYESLPYQQPEALSANVHHVMLDLSFDWELESVSGRAVLTASAYAAPVDTLVLDAQGFDLELVQIKRMGIWTEAAYRYDRKKLMIEIIPALRQNDTIELSIDYTARPTLIPGETGGGEAIRSNQGLYFIQGDGKPKQIWTQGETWYNSTWFPFIDRPDDKFTQEIYLTVDSAYHTVSNGKLIYSSLNADGTRTDYWKQALPHSGYLSMLAIGEFALAKDGWNGIDVWYYLDPEYRPYAYDIFGNTPEMLQFFSDKLGVIYPWEKFHQVVVKDFVSGAMENTSAVIHGDFVQHTRRELLDESDEDVIAHELFHHWFGDLVTCESWSHLTLNEGFATYGEFLWNEYKYGIESARLAFRNDLSAYLSESRNKQYPLIRYRYAHPDDLFDNHSYQKGALVIHTLRREVGDSLFFASLTYYLEQHAYGSVEADDLRQAFEHVTGRDLRWFFDQWFFGSGHPVVQVQYAIDSVHHMLQILTEQRMSDSASTDWVPFTFQLPVSFQCETGPVKTHLFTISNRRDTFRLPLYDEWPVWYTVDPFGDVLWEVNEVKPMSAWRAQVTGAPSYHSRERAYMQLLSNKDTALNRLFFCALRDPFWAVRETATSYAPWCVQDRSMLAFSLLSEVARNDEHPLVRSSAWYVIDSLWGDDSTMTSHFIGGLHDSSLAVVEACAWVMSQRNPCLAMPYLGPLEAVQRPSLQYRIAEIYAACADGSKADYFARLCRDGESFAAYAYSAQYFKYVVRVGGDSLLDAFAFDLSKNALELNSWWHIFAATTFLPQVSGIYEAELQFYTDKPEPRATVDSVRMRVLSAKIANVEALLLEIGEVKMPEE